MSLHHRIHEDRPQQKRHHGSRARQVSWALNRRVRRLLVRGLHSKSAELGFPRSCSSWGYRFRPIHQQPRRWWVIGQQRDLEQKPSSSIRCHQWIGHRQGHGRSLQLFQDQSMKDRLGHWHVPIRIVNGRYKMSRWSTSPKPILPWASRELVGPCCHRPRQCSVREWHQRLATRWSAATIRPEFNLKRADSTCKQTSRYFGERWNPMQFLKLHRCRRLSTESHSDSSHHVVQWLLVQQWQSKRCRLVRGDEQHRPFPSAPNANPASLPTEMFPRASSTSGGVGSCSIASFRTFVPTGRIKPLSRSKQVEPFDCPNLRGRLIDIGIIVVGSSSTPPKKLLPPTPVTLNHVSLWMTFTSCSTNVWFNCFRLFNGLNHTKRTLNITRKRSINMDIVDERDSIFDCAWKLYTVPLTTMDEFSSSVNPNVPSPYQVELIGATPFSSAQAFRTDRLKIEFDPHHWAAYRPSPRFVCAEGLEHHQHPSFQEGANWCHHQHRIEHRLPLHWRGEHQTSNRNRSETTLSMFERLSNASTTVALMVVTRPSSSSLQEDITASFCLNDLRRERWRHRFVLPKRFKIKYSSVVELPVVSRSTTFHYRVRRRWELHRCVVAIRSLKQQHERLVTIARLIILLERPWCGRSHFVIGHRLVPRANVGSLFCNRWW